MFNFYKRVASLFPTFFPFVHTLYSLIISICPFWIFVGMESAWKNAIYEGSRPVGPGGIVTSIGATVPTLAGVDTLFDSINGLISKTGAYEKMRPTFPLQRAANLSS